MTDQAIESPAVDPAELESLQRRTAIRFACLIVGSLGIVASVILLADPAAGFTAISASAIALAIALSGSGTWESRKEWPHAIAVILSAAAAFGLCATGCGTHKLYQDFLGFPTAALGMVVHGFTVAAIILQRRYRPDAPFFSDLMIAAGIAGSLFYGGILAWHGTWCGACFAIHALMFVQLIELMINRIDLVYRTALIATVIAGAGLLNASYHHRDVPTSRNDPDDLLAYLRSAWTAPLPPRPVVQETASMRQPDATAPRQPAGIMSPPVEAISQSSPLAPEAPSAPASTGRSAADANRWGSSSARIALIVAIDPTCPHCAALFPELLELHDLVEKGVIQVRFLLGYENDTGQAMASIAYAAGLQSDKALLDTLDSFFRNQGKILTTADAVQVLPISFPRDAAVALVRSRQADITGLLVDASRVKQGLGFTGDPMIWVQVADRPKPSRVFNGATMAPELRVAISSVAP